MKGIHFVFAIVLGLLGALCNYFYLENKVPDVEVVGFVGIQSDAEVARGERLSPEHLMEVNIPRRNVGSLQDVAVPYSAVQSVLGSRVWRPLPGGTLLLRQDLTTPPQELKLAANEAIIWIPIDNRSTVPSLIVPGDQVSFLIATSRLGMPTRAPDPESGGLEPIPESSAASGAIKTVGPFTILSLGNRLGTPDVLKAARVPVVQENVVGIRVEIDDKGDLMPDAQHLVELLNATGNYPVGVLLHGRGEKAR
jgi:hypothetical protein